MIVKTKKYQLSKDTYVKLAMQNVLLEWRWVWLVPVAIMIIPIFVSGAFWWCFGISLLASVLYLLFWFVQFTAITQMDQQKAWFEKLTYEINSQQILMKINPKEGMVLPWDRIQRVKQGKDYFMLIFSRGQFLLWPHNIFKSDTEIRMLEMILRRKGLIPPPKEGKEKAAATPPAPQQ